MVAIFSRTTWLYYLRVNMAQRKEIQKGLTDFISDLVWRTHKSPATLLFQTSWDVCGRRNKNNNNNRILFIIFFLFSKFSWTLNIGPHGILFFQSYLFRFTHRLLNFHSVLVYTVSISRWHTMTAFRAELFYFTWADVHYLKLITIADEVDANWR